MLLIFSLIILAGSGCARNNKCDPVHYQIWGYYPHWIKDEWKKIDLRLFDRVFFFDIPVSVAGTVLETSDWPRNWQKLIVAAKEKGSRLQLTFTLFDAAVFERVFTNQNLQNTLKAQMLVLLDQADSGGLQIDFEIFSPVSDKSAEGFRLFLKTIKNDLANRKKSLTLFVLSHDRAGLYDKETIGRADFIVIQGYDIHWKESVNAGPITQLRGKLEGSWELSLEYYLSLGIPRNKIIMSVPYFGYEWPTVSNVPGAMTRAIGSEISFAPLPANLVPDVKASAMARIKQYGARRDATTGSPYYIFKDESGWYQGWYEDDKSLSAKFEYVKENRLAGIAVFPLGYDDGKMQNLLRSHFRPPNCR